MQDFFGYFCEIFVMRWEWYGGNAIRRRSTRQDHFTTGGTGEHRGYCSQSMPSTMNLIPSRRLCAQDEFYMAPSATTINENGVPWQYAVPRRVVQRSSTLLVLESPRMSLTRDALWHNGL